MKKLIARMKNFYLVSLLPIILMLSACGTVVDVPRYNPPVVVERPYYEPPDYPEPIIVERPRPFIIERPRVIVRRERRVIVRDYRPHREFRRMERREHRGRWH